MFTHFWFHYCFFNIVISSGSQATRDACACNRVANAMFAAIHLNNLLGTDTPREEVYLQCAMAFVLGAPTV